MKKYLRLVLLLAFCGALIGLGVRASRQTTNSLTLHAIQSDIKKGALLVDIRSRDEYQQKHAVGAVNIPLEEIQKGTSLNIPLATPIYLHSPAESTTNAINVFTTVGYSRVTSIGSLDDWIRLGGKTEIGSKNISN